MKGSLYLAWRHLVHFRGRSAVLVACLALPIFLPLAVRQLAQRYEDGLRARAAATPALVGAAGSRFDLVLAALHFRPLALAPLAFGECEQLALAGEGLAVPLHLGYTARGQALVGTSPEYFEARGLLVATGRRTTRLGECVLGARAATALGLGAGDSLYSDQPELYDISKPPALKLFVSGVLAPAGTPDDEAVFVDVKTAWVLEGLAHGHVDVTASDFDPGLVLGRGEGHVAVSAALIEHAELTPQTLGSVHFHRAPAEMPLSAVLFFPRDDKAGTLARTRTNRRPGLQMIVPARVVDELLALVLRIERAIEALLAALALGMLGLLALVIALSSRLRAREMRTLSRIGAAASVSLRLQALEFGTLLALAAGLAGLGCVLLSLLLPDPIQLL